MKVAVTANGVDLDAPISTVFGRCPTYILVDTQTMEFEAFENPEKSSLRGTGFQAPEFVAKLGAQAVVTGNIGPNALSVLQPSRLVVTRKALDEIKQRAANAASAAG